MRIALIFLLYAFQTQAQVVDRYNYVQRPTDSSVTIAWRTVSTSTGTINWGLTPGNLSNSLSEPSATSKHYFDISGLTPNTLYYYQTSDDLGYTSDVDHFYTAKTDSTNKFSFLHYGDCGYNNGVQSTIGQLMGADSTDFAVVAGDIDQGVGDNYDEVFFGVYQDMLKHACHFTAIGNHDTYADNAATYLDDFYLPSNNPQQTERYYSFTWGNAKFICMDSNIPYTFGTDQYEWLVDELACNQSQWLFVFFHHPPWTNAWSADYYVPFTEYFLYEGNVDMRTELVPLFEDYNVDFVLNGHSHCYQRGELNGVKYVISGGAGSALMDFNTNSNSPNIDTEIYVNQYVRFDVDGDTVRYMAIDDLGATIDSVTTIKPNTVLPPPTITYVGGELWSTPGVSYTWFLDGIEIMGVTTQNFIPTQFGTYHVEVTTTIGCILTSELFVLDNLNVPVIESIEFRLYPNPTTGKLTIESNESFVSGAIIKITNSIGQLVFEDVVENTTKLYQLHLEEAPKGMYILNVTMDNSVITERFVIE